MRAIFSVGLKFCTAKKVQALLPEGKHDIEAIESYLHQFRYFNDSKANSRDPNLPRDSKTQTDVSDLNAELASLNKSINTQLNLMEKYKSSIERLITIRDDLARRLYRAEQSQTLTQMRSPEEHNALAGATHVSPYFPPGAAGTSDFPPTLTAFPGPPPEMMQAPSAGGMTTQIPPPPAATSKSSAKKGSESPRRLQSELDMLSVMRSHMNMHREFLDLNSQYTSSEPFLPEHQLRAPSSGDLYPIMTAPPLDPGFEFDDRARLPKPSVDPLTGGGGEVIVDQTQHGSSFPSLGEDPYSTRHNPEGVAAERLPSGASADDNALIQDDDDFGNLFDFLF